MSRTYIPAALRQLVFDRASGRCEYCRFPEQMAFATFECEHIVAEKHGGATTADNLALAVPSATASRVPTWVRSIQKSDCRA
jgi:hypothetical protein